MKFSQFTSGGRRPARNDRMAGRLAAGGAGSNREWFIGDQIRFASKYEVQADGLTNDTANLQAAIDDTPDGGMLVLPDTGLCKLIGSGSACLTINRPMTIMGLGWNSGIFADASVPNTRDIIAVAPSSSNRGWRFDNFRIFNNSSARHGINFGGGGAGLIYSIQIDRMLIDATAGGKSINTFSTSSGALAYSTIMRCLLDSLSIDDAGDGLQVCYNSLGGTGLSMYYDAVAGAGGLVVFGNVLAGLGGQLQIDRCVGGVVSCNEFEQPSNSTNANGAMLDLNGATSGSPDFALCQDVDVSKNNFSVNAGVTGVTGAIRVNNVQGATINTNKIRQRSTGKHIVTTSGAYDTRILEENRYWTDDAIVRLSITDNGNRTYVREIVQTLAQPLQPPVLIEKRSAQSGIIAGDSFLSLSANQTGTDTASAQTWFPGGGATTITVPANSTWEFEGMIAATKTAGTTARTVSQLFGGTAGITSIMYDGLSATADVATFPIIASPLWSAYEAATAQALVGSSSSANQAWLMKIKGVIRFSSAGTFIPQFKYSAAPGGAPTVRANTFFKMRQLGLDNALNVGNWS